MIERLDLDQISIAAEMAICLAIVHWQAQVDGMDMEFVLGTPAATRYNLRRGTTSTPHLLIHIDTI